MYNFQNTHLLYTPGVIGRNGKELSSATRASADSPPSVLSWVVTVADKQVISDLVLFRRAGGYCTKLRKRFFSSCSKTECLAAYFSSETSSSAC